MYESAWITMQTSSFSRYLIRETYFLKICEEIGAIASKITVKTNYN
jgi:hypothetical protein